MKNKFKVLGVIAIIAVIGLSVIACDDGSGGGGPGGGDPLAAQLNGTWKAGDGTEYTLNNGSFVIAQNGKQSMRGTYTAAARSISANLTLAVTEVHGDYLAEVEEGPTFDNKWYNKNQVTDAFRNWMKEEHPSLSDAQITAFLAGQSGEIDALFPTKTATVDGDSMTVDGKTFTKNGGSTGGGGAMTWTAVANSTFGTSHINAIAYGGGKFVAVGYKGKIATSPDGVTWTEITTTAFDYYVNQTAGSIDTVTINAIAYGNGMFVAVGDHYTTAYSTDGITWTVDIGWYTYKLKAIAFGNGTFVVAGDRGSIATSTDGVTWTEITTTAFDFVSLGYTFPQDNYAIAYGNGTFVAGGSSGKIAYSSDNGATWTPVTGTTLFDDRAIDAIAYGGGKFVTGSRSGKMAYSSDNGVTWTDITTTAIVYTNSSGKTVKADINAIAYGNGRFVVAGDHGSIATSTDGVTWTAVGEGILGNDSIGDKADISAIAYGNGTFVAVGENGKMAYSTGGSSNSGTTPQTATYTGTAGGTAYTLKITENTARYAAQSGDDYELTDGAKKSAGKVNSVSGSVLTLKPSNATATFTATVSGSSLTALNGTITWTDNTTASAPGTFTGGTNPGTGDGGTFTLTDIPSEYNGKYAYFSNASGDNVIGAGITVVGFQSYTGDRPFVRISNGKVSIPAWLVNTKEQTFVRYSGNDTFDVSFSISEVDTLTEHLKDTHTLAGGIFSSVKFSNGSATKSRNDATQWFKLK